MLGQRISLLLTSRKMKTSAGLGHVHKADSRFRKCFPNIDTFRQGGPYQILPFNL